jgi:hypothetical protein
MAPLRSGSRSLCNPFILTALLSLGAAPARSDTLQTTHATLQTSPIPTQEAGDTSYATATPPARPLDGLEAYRCGNYAVFAGPTLSTVRYWEQHGVTPQRAAEMTSRGGADASLAEMAALAPDSTMLDDFRRQTLVDCLNAASDRK